MSGDAYAEDSCDTFFCGNGDVQRAVATVFNDGGGQRIIANRTAESGKEFLRPAEAAGNLHAVGTFHRTF